MKPFVLIGLLLCLCAGAQPGARKNYYILLSADKEYVDLGEYLGNRYKKKLFVRMRLDSLDKTTFMKCFGLSGDTSELLVYVHCWLGNENNFHRTTLKSLNATTAGCPLIGKTLSIIWKPRLEGYEKSWIQAGEGGRRLSRVLLWLSERESGTTSFFCHSMGNRVFEGMVENLDSSATRRAAFREVVLAAADLHAWTFTSGLRRLPALSQRIHILKHRRDKLLLSSQLLLGARRLGRQGPDNCDSLLQHHPNIYVADATSERLFSSFDPSNHVYFYKGFRVRRHLGRIYAHEAMPPGGAERVIFLE